MANTIQLKGEFRLEEALGSGTIKPGMLLELTSDVAVKAHATEGGFAERAFAVEDALQGKTVADSYTTGTLVSYALAAPGGEINALLKAGVIYTVGTQLISGADGTLIRVADKDSQTDIKQIIAVVAEAVDLSGSGAVDTLTPVRVL